MKYIALTIAVTALTNISLASNFEEVRHDDQRLASVFYYIVLLLVVGTPIVAALRKNFSQSVVQLCTWFAIVTLLIGAYSFRHEFYDFKERIYAELVPGYARTSQQGELIINEQKDGHYYISSLINDTPITLMVDTGASKLVLAKRHAKQLGINLDELNFTHQFSTANGKTFAAPIRLDSLQIGHLYLTDVNAFINQGDVGSALLGMSILEQFSSFEFKQDKLILRP